MGIIQNILNLKQNAIRNQQEQEAFATQQMKSRMDMSAQDIMNQMNLSQAGQPVQNGNIQEPTQTYNTPIDLSTTSPKYGVDQNGNSTMSMASTGGPSLPATTTVPGGPTPVDPSRRIVTYQSPSNGSMQYALNSPQQNIDLFNAAAERTRQNKAQDTLAEQNALETAREQAIQRSRQNQLTLEGGGTPAPAGLASLGWKPGEPMTRAEIADANTQLLSQAKGGAEIGKTAAETGKTSAETQGLQIQNQMRQKALEAQRTGQDPIKAMMPDGLDDTARTAYQTAYQNAVSSGSLTAPQEVLNATAAHVSAIQQHTNPLIQNAELQKQLTLGTAMSGIHQKAQDAEKAKSTYVSSAQEMNSAEAAAQDFMRVLDQADAGNTAAAGQIKAMLPELTNSVQGIKRMGAGQGNQNLGDLGDRLLGLVGGVTEGQPIDANVRKQIRELVPVLATSAVTAHNLNVRTLNGTYGTNFPEAPIPQTTGQASSASQVRVIAPNGKIGTIPAEQLTDALGKGYKQIK